ncbi:DsbA family protein [Vibrio cholerae]|uniref:Protein-disulfide isomerase n=2 Tax=Vibrio splendidus TaxID=29497 RepID=A0A2T5EJY3_VIBSP|nr:DsbA family protein [Vibrio cholerae]PTP20547.1 protein-disulfide isomerase [Vibrio splendidus]
MQKKLLAVGVAMTLLLGASVATVGYQIYQTKELLIQQRDSLQSQITQLESDYRFKSEERFNNAVQKALEHFVQQKREQDIQAKYAKYESAPEQVPDDKRIYGNLNARFTLVEFSDLECPFCKKFHDTPKEVVEASNGNINWQWKHLPLSFHNPAAEKEALAAECVAEQKGNRGFWVFLDEVFAKSQGNGGGVPNLAEVIESVGADASLVRECLASGRYDLKIAADVKQATENGISGTPATFIVDNQTGKTQLIRGAQPSQAIAAIIRKMMIESENN